MHVKLLRARRGRARQGRDLGLGRGIGGKEGVRDVCEDLGEIGRIR